jgi:protein-S-isoprenylcysteine O-methyltransferase Ste14
MNPQETLARLRVPLGWVLGLVAIFLAEPTRTYLILGVGVAAAGEMLRLWASGHLDKDRQLATGGPYAWTRNPLYLGNLLVGLGFVAATGRFLLLPLLALLFVAIYVPVMKREEGRLLAAFPIEYPGYASAVPLLVPRIPRRTDGETNAFSWSRVWRNREPVTVLGMVLVIAALWGKWMLR